MKLSALVLAMLAPVAAAAAPVDGLLADYTDGQRRVTTVVRTPHFSLVDKESIHPAIKPAFSAAFTGSLKVLIGGKYSFRAAPATLILDGKPVADGAVTELGAGVHTLRLEYRRTQPTARVQLSWQSEAFELEPVPASAFLHDGEPPAVAQWRGVDRGRELVDDLNCAGCHGGGGSGRGRGPNLGNVGGRTTAAWLTKWLENPTAYRPNAKMPVMALTPDERRDVVAFLSTVIHRGFAAADIIKDLEPTPERQAQGQKLFDKVGCVACHGQGAGMVTVEGVGSKTKYTELRDYLMKPARTEPTGRMPSFHLKEEDASALAAFLSTKKRADLEAGAAAGGDAKRGRELVTARGCLNCHNLEIDTKTVASTLKVMPLSAVRPDRGCLSANPPAKAPRYRLTADQRAAIVSYLRVPDVAESPLAEFKRQVDFFRCRACHELGGAPLVPFEHGPPSLSDTGNKLRPEWIREVVGGRARTRRWMDLRMPEFQPARPMAEQFAAVAGASRTDPPAEAKPEALAIRQGVRYIGRGEEGLSCITCHHFGSFDPGSATPAPDMISMHQRTRPEWFRRWMLDPNRIQPGTQMPAYFTDVAKNVSHKKITEVWAALSLGKGMPVPEGVVAENFTVKLLAEKDPVLFRTFLAGGAVRSIVVGFPGGQAYAFDADACRLQFAWSGELLDVRPVWMERGGGEAKVLGEKYYTAPDGPALRIGDADKAPQVAWKGYVLEKKTPVMLYQLDGATVREKIESAPGNRGLVRSFEVKGHKGKPIWFLPGPAGGADISAQGATRDGDRFRAAGKGSAVRFSVTITSNKIGPAAAAPLKK